MVALAVFLQAPAHAELFSSMVGVTPENIGKLHRHELEIKGDSRDGTTHVMLRVLPEKGDRVQSCHVTLYASAVSKPPILACFKVEVSDELLYFSVADELVGRVSIKYQLGSDLTHIEVFEIDATQLPKLIGNVK